MKKFYIAKVISEFVSILKIALNLSEKKNQFTILFFFHYSLLS